MVVLIIYRVHRDRFPCKAYEYTANIRISDYKRDLYDEIRLGCRLIPALFNNSWKSLCTVPIVFNAYEYQARTTNGIPLWCHVLWTPLFISVFIRPLAFVFIMPFVHYRELLS